MGSSLLTPADVAAAAGVSTGALVQRYGSKRGLLLAFLHLELADDEFRALLGDHIRGVRAELLGYLEAAVAGGHLVSTADLAALASAADSIRNGTQLTWAMTRSGSLADALRRDQHSRRRAGGETKRLWSAGKTGTCSGAARRSSNPPGAARAADRNLRSLGLCWPIRVVIIV
ncbi:AcrR family transcriptional regulator [Streptosporangium album]|uniref:AcrR family transcriptional regulator n=1 Tax=Streptosporangium album TaxID=47479 RepID=A0A7W7WET7_9ACTN|nr:TetR family transcriptional regulator [Streptosporangium album]MBB4943800.1 AcrR family transcriptional regulator [Streptosporangium album]